MPKIKPATLKKNLLAGRLSCEHIELTARSITSSSTGDDYVVVAAQALEENSECIVEALIFEGMGVTDAALATLGSAIPNSSKLHYLSFRDNTDITAAGVRSIAEGASRCTSLTNIRFDGCTGIGAQGLNAFVEFNPPLRLLFLSNIGIGDAGMPLVAELLRKNTTLWRLILSNNGITDTSALADALSENSTLKEIWLHNNDITDSGVGGMVEAITKNQRLEKVGLYGNRLLTDAAGELLLTALSHNNMLKDVDVRKGTNMSENMQNRIHTLSEDVEGRRQQLEISNPPTRKRRRTSS